MRLMFERYSIATIGYFNHDTVNFIVRFYGDGAVGESMLNRIVQQIADSVTAATVVAMMPKYFIRFI